MPAAIQSRLRQQADGQVGARDRGSGPRRSGARSSGRARSMQHRDVLLPGRDRVGLVQAHRRRESRPRGARRPARRRPAPPRPASGRRRSSRGIARGRSRSRSRGGSRASPSSRRAVRSRPAKRSGSGSPTMLSIAVPRSASSSTRCSIHGGVQPTTSSGACAAALAARCRRRCSWLSTRRAPSAYATRAIARTSGACSM